MACHFGVTHSHEEEKPLGVLMLYGKNGVLPRGPEEI
jgi:hypothetical protein